MTELSEEQLDSMTRAMIPRANTKATLPSLSERTEAPWSRSRGRFDEDMDKSIARAVERARSRGRDRFDDFGADIKAGGRPQSRGRDRFDEFDADKSVARSMVRARSQGRDRFEDAAIDKPKTRDKSRGRGERSESIRQLTSRALDSGKEKSPLARRMSSNDMIDVSAPNSLALVPVTPKDDYGAHYGGPPPTSSRRGGSNAYDRVDSAYTESSNYTNALIPYSDYDRPRHRGNYHKSRYDERSSRGDERRRERDERRRERMDDDRSRGGRSHKSRDNRHKDHRRRDVRHRPQGGYHEDDYGPRPSRGPRDPSVYGDIDGDRPHNRDDRYRPRGGKPRSSRTRDP